MPFEIASAAAAVTDDTTRPHDFRVSLVDAPGDHAYPITSFTWMLLAPKRTGIAKTRQLVDFLRWALVDGGATAGTTGYVALPTVTAARVLRQLDELAPREKAKP